MKRILKAGIVGTAVSMFFTGCGSSALVTGGGAGYQEIKWQVVETQENKDKLGESGLKDDETLPAKEMPDYYEEQYKEKSEKDEGTPAFKIKEGHSDDVKDLSFFEVGTLQNDGTFIYCYSTKQGTLSNDAEDDNRPIVHCMAAYNYIDKQFKVIHENVFTREESDFAEDRESFYMQMCSSDGSGDMFVYDNGIGYLYGSTGSAKFITSIETFVRKYFRGYSVVTTQALMEGGDRIYVDLVIEKEEISTVEEESTTEVSEEDADKEAEELDNEFSEKTIEVVLVYDFEEYTSSIDQTNLNLNVQALRWQTLGAGFSGEVGEEPSEEDDWQRVMEISPNVWGPAYLYGYEGWSQAELQLCGIHDPYFEGTPIFQWTGDKVFEYREDGYVPTFVPKWGSFQPFQDLKSNTTLTNVFVLRDGKYYELFGTTGNDLGEGDYRSVSFTREITRKDDVTKEDGTTETQNTTVTQTISKERKRDTYPNNSYLEGYWIMEGCDSVFDIVDEDVFCITNEKSDETEYDVINWLKSDGTKEPIVKVEADTLVDIFKDNGSLYMSITYDNWTSIQKLNLETKASESSAGIYSDAISNVIKKFELEGSKVDSKYHEQYEKMSTEDKKQTLEDNGGEQLSGGNFLHVSLADTHKELLQKIEDYTLSEIERKNSSTSFEFIKNMKEYKSASLISEIGNEGYLITSFAHGLVYYDKKTQKAISLDEGTWYGTWRGDNKFISVGFSSNNTSYSALDIAHSRVYEYSFDTLYETGLNAIAASTGQKIEKKEGDEGTKQMQEDFDTKRKNQEPVFVTPEEEEWKDNTPGSEMKKIEQDRKNAEEEERKKKEAAGEWDPLDEVREKY